MADTLLLQYLRGKVVMVFPRHLKLQRMIHTTALSSTRHQFNYKGQQVFLFQNNTEVAVPFIVSLKKYPNINFKYFETSVTDKNLNLVINL